jgi:hypothetical protein
MLTIKDLAVSKSLGSKEMSAVRGGVNLNNAPIFQAGLQSGGGIGNVQVFNAVPTQVNVAPVNLTNIAGLQLGLVH